MNIKQQGLIVDYIFKKVSPKYPNIIPDDLRSEIYKILKRHKGSIQNTPKLKSIVEEKTLIANVKERHCPTQSQPFGVARQIVRRIRNECI